MTKIRAMTYLAAFAVAVVVLVLVARSVPQDFARGDSAREKQCRAVCVCVREYEVGRPLQAEYDIFGDPGVDRRTTQ